jgi:aspartyl-tRNA(Asn)/glutamyl-tRNA(Gln) amidotransferase subunit C
MRQGKDGSPDQGFFPVFCGQAACARCYSSPACGTFGAFPGQKFHSEIKTPISSEFPLSFDQSDVEKIAHLARLAVTDEEAQELTGDLSRILDLVAQMEQVETSSVEPMAHPLNMNQRLREDRVTEENNRELYQSVAPSTENGLYLVPKVIE